MNLRRVDLNLLVAFDALMRTRHVGRAGDLLGLGQPAMSAALSRLRYLFGDDLLVRQGGGMAATERAIQLAPEVSRLLKEINRLIEEPQGFDPAVSQMTFRLRLSDLLSALILPKLLQHLAETAPGISLEVVHLSPEATVDALERGDIDLAVSTGLSAPKSIRQAILFVDRLVCLTRAEAALDNTTLTAATFASLPQIRVSQSPLDDRFIDRQLAAAGLKRRIVLTLPHWLALPEIIEQTELLAVVPESIATRLVTGRNLTFSPSPLTESGFDWSLYWHRRTDNDAAHVWLRKIIEEIT
tara:strand:+ start:24029 stop:24925 length:897 start_codon:yes stop_codon:yes gene_type:complete